MTMSLLQSSSLNKNALACNSLTITLRRKLHGMLFSCSHLAPLHVLYRIIFTLLLRIPVSINNNTKMFQCILKVSHISVADFSWLRMGKMAIRLNHRYNPDSNKQRRFVSTYTTESDHLLILLDIVIIRGLK